MRCKHQFCSDCLKQWLETKIEASNSEFIQIKHTVYYIKSVDGTPSLCKKNLEGLACPCKHCNFIIESHRIKQLVNEQSLERYDKLLLDDTLKTFDDLKYCPMGCGKIMQSCYCETPECYKKMKKEELFQENKRLKIEQSSHKRFGAWAGTFTKCCPNCYVSIEKNMGCDHMYCTRCNTNFNWSQAPSFTTAVRMNKNWYSEKLKKSKKQEN
eukprot:TRINITY_DN5694_c0_g1_i1.p1 TRINITY_DN5694_c0_g1~~TRINITY_DN5694_c0_g1_i1.p1  ORF type:complete len:212 (+),score=11.45 TRINITY_DN5694_c0_g1_i1:298-933(+)